MPNQGAVRRDPVGDARVIGSLFLVAIPLYAIFQGLQQILIPAQVQVIDPAGKVGTLAMLTTATSLCAVAGILLGGSVSDRTATRFGKRNPWILGMALLSSLLVSVAGSLQSLFSLVVIYCIIWFTLNFYQAAMMAVLPERISVARRGIASSALGLATPLGIAIGVTLAGAVPAHTAFLVMSVGLAAGACLFVVAAPETSVSVTAHALRGEGAAERGHALSAFQFRDFTCAFISRALLFLGYFSVNGFLYYIVTDRIDPETLGGIAPAAAVARLAVLGMGAWILAVPVAGWLADRFDRRKLAVGLSSVGMALAMLLPAFSNDWVVMQIFAAASGMFFGIYIAVDLALMSLVLPEEGAVGRDMAILTVASAGPQIAAPSLAGLVISFAGYPALFWLGSVLALGGGVSVLLIRSVR